MDLDYWLESSRVSQIAMREQEGKTIDLVVEVGFPTPGKAVGNSTVISPRSKGFLHIEIIISSL